MYDIAHLLGGLGALGILIMIVLIIMGVWWIFLPIFFQHMHSKLMVELVQIREELEKARGVSVPPKKPPAKPKFPGLSKEK